MGGFCANEGALITESYGINVVRFRPVGYALDTSVDYLLFGSTADKASAALQDAEVIRYFKEIELMPVEDKAVLLKVIVAFIRDNKAKQAYAR